MQHGARTKTQLSSSCLENRIPLLGHTRRMLVCTDSGTLPAGKTADTAAWKLQQALEI
jgi:hypothetical protein